MKNEVTLNDIAKKLGVSSAAVSKALSGKEGVGEELKRKIIEEARNSGYRTKAKAVPAKNMTIGVVASERFLKESGTYYWRLYSEISLVANEKGHLTILEVVGAEDERKPECPKLIKHSKADALIVLGAFGINYLKLLTKEAGCPLLALDSVPEFIKGDAVMADNITGGFKMTEYLINAGFERIGYVGTLRTTPSIDDRYLGYLKAMLFHGKKADPKWVITDRDEETGYVDAEGCFELPAKEDMPDAFFCDSDLSAQIMIGKLRAKGYKVPKDISIVGFDHFLPEKTENISLVTYETDLREMARAAVKLLDHRIQDPVMPYSTLIIRGKLIKGNSVLLAT